MRLQCLILTRRASALRAWLLFLPLLALLSGCLDDPYGEISVRTTRRGKRQGCTVQVFNEAGKQVQEVPTDNVGLLFLKNMKPGTYTLKFISNKDKMYPAEKTVTVRSDGNEVVDVDLDEKPLPKPPPTEEELRREKAAKTLWPFD